MLGIGGVAVISKEIAWILFVVGLILAVMGWTYEAREVSERLEKLGVIS